MSIFSRLYHNLTLCGTYVKQKKNEININEIAQINVLEIVKQYPPKSNRAYTMEVVVSQYTVVRSLKQHKHSAYKLSVSQSLNAVDLNKRLEFI